MTDTTSAETPEAPAAAAATPATAASAPKAVKRPSARRFRHNQPYQTIAGATAALAAQVSPSTYPPAAHEAVTKLLSQIGDVPGHVTNVNLALNVQQAADGTPQPSSLFLQVLQTPLGG